MAQVRRVLLLEPFGDLGEPAVPGDERRAAAGGGLGCNHPERLGEDRGHDRCIRQREQVREVAVLERAREEDAAAGPALELDAEVPEPDDDRTRVDPVERLEQKLDALVLDQLPEVDDGGLIAREKGRKPLRVPLVGQSFLPVPWVGRVGAGLGKQVCERLVPALRAELVDVDAGRHLVDAFGDPRDLLDDAADVGRADVDRLCGFQAVPPPPLELGPAAHRVLELGAVRLDPERPAEVRADRSAHQDVVREDEAGGAEVAEGGDVRLDVGGPLGGREVLEEPRLEPLVAVEDERGQQASRQLRPDHLGSRKVVPARVALLADHRHLVPGEAPFPRQGSGVDVRARSPEQVPVPEVDPHYVRWKYSACSSSTAGFEVCTVTSGGQSRRASL